MARFSKGKKQKSKNLLTLLDSYEEFSEGLGVKRAFFRGLEKFQGGGRGRILSEGP